MVTTVRHVSLAALLGIVIGLCIFLGWPLWLGSNGLSATWLVVWSFMMASVSPSGVEMIDDLLRPDYVVDRPIVQTMRGAMILTRMGAIGLALYLFGSTVF